MYFVLTEGVSTAEAESTWTDAVYGFSLWAEN